MILNTITDKRLGKNRFNGLRNPTDPASEQKRIVSHSDHHLVVDETKIYTNTRLLSLALPTLRNHFTLAISDRPL